MSSNQIISGGENIVEDKVTRLPIGSMADTMLKVGVQGIVFSAGVILLFLARGDIIELFQGLREDLKDERIQGREERAQSRKVLESLVIQQEKTNIELSRVSALLQQQINQQTKLLP